MAPGPRANGPAIDCAAQILHASIGFVCMITQGQVRVGLTYLSRICNLLTRRRTEVGIELFRANEEGKVKRHAK